jgi:TonB-dependent SusC/RagA subfamily outer membrane receptor
VNPEDIETMTVLKGPEAAALYGIDAANGAIVITTKRGKQGGGFEYDNSFRVETTRAEPAVQHEFGPSGVGSTTFLYFGAPYPDNTTFYAPDVGGWREAGRPQRRAPVPSATTQAAAENRAPRGVAAQLG